MAPSPQKVRMPNNGNIHNCQSMLLLVQLVKIRFILSSAVNENETAEDIAWKSEGRVVEARTETAELQLGISKSVLPKPTVV